MRTSRVDVLEDIVKFVTRFGKERQVPGRLPVSQRRLVLSTLLAAFRGPEAPRWALDLVAEGLAGHVLFGVHVEDTAQLSAPTPSPWAGRPGGAGRRAPRGGGRR